MINHPHRSRQKDLPALPFHLPRWLKDWQRGKVPKPEHVRSQRKFSGLSQAELAVRVHRSKRWIEDIEQGDQSDAPERLARDENRMFAARDRAGADDRGDSRRAGGDQCLI